MKSRKLFGNGSIILGTSLGVLVGFTALVYSHSDDPKIRDRQAPYKGTGYRASAAQSGGGQYGSLGEQFDSQGVTLLSWLSLDDFSGNPASGNDCWGYVSQSGREYAVMGLANSTAFVDISNPSAPNIVGQISGPNSLWRDVKIYQRRAYAVSEGGNGIQVINLTNIDQGVVTLERTVTSPGTQNTHNVAIDEESGFLYRCGGGDEGLRIYSLASPGNPTYVGSWSDRYVHDAQIVTYTSGPFAGMQVAFCCGGLDGGWTDTSLDIVDVTNKNNPQLMGRVRYSNRAYSHQGWLSEDRQYFYLDDELDENGSINTRTIIVDVSDLNNPFQVGNFTNNSTSVGHNLYTRGNFIYEANYRSGLRVFNAMNPVAPVEVAYFDTYPGSDSANFNGLWSCYPNLPSGVVIGSDIERGLFVWWVGDPQLQFNYPNGLPELFDPAGTDLRFQVDEATPGALDPSTLKFFYDAGQGYVEANVVDLGGNTFDAQIPSLPCGSTVSYYLTADSTNGITWNDPPAAPGESYSATAANGVNNVLFDDLESNSGWTSGAAGDNATTGIWVRVNPRGTDAQPEDDHTPSGTQCWVTGQGPVGGGIGDNDVDGGRTTLLTPSLNMNGYQDPYVSYWRWYSNDENSSVDDVFVIDISSNGSNWVNVETIGPTGSESSGGWFYHQFRVADFVSLTNNVQLRFVASDLGSGSIVEAAIDDFSIDDIDCDGQADPPGDCVPHVLYGNSTPGSGGIDPSISSPNWPYTGNANWRVQLSEFLGGINGNLIIGFASDSDNSQGWERLVGLTPNPLFIPVVYSGAGPGVGSVELNFSIRNNPFLQGLRVYLQGIGFRSWSPEQYLGDSRPRGRDL